MTSNNYPGLLSDQIACFSWMTNNYNWTMDFYKTGCDDLPCLDVGIRIIFYNFKFVVRLEFLSRFQTPLQL